MRRLSETSARARPDIVAEVRAPTVSHLVPLLTMAMLLTMWLAFVVTYLAAREVGAVWPAFVGIPMLLPALPASYVLFWLIFNFQPRAFGAALGLWVAVMFAMTPLAVWGTLALT